jgi:hypothetical protein
MINEAGELDDPRAVPSVSTAGPESSSLRGRRLSGRR